MTTTNTIHALAAGAFLLAGASGAVAADLGPYKPYQAPPPEFVEAPLEAPIWQGAYIGLNGGYAQGSSGLTDPDGVFGGGQLGYNWQRDRFVFGVEGDFQGGDVDDGSSFNGGFGAATTDINWFSTLRARAGVTNGPALLYVTGGVAFAEIDTQIVSLAPAASFSDSSTRTGYAVGGGLEYQLSSNWTAKAEYLYLDFGNDTISGMDGGGNPIRADIDTDAHVGRVGFNYKF